MAIDTRMPGWAVHDGPKITAEAVMSVLGFMQRAKESDAAMAIAKQQNTRAEEQFKTNQKLNNLKIQSETLGLQVAQREADHTANDLAELDRISLANGELSNPAAQLDNLRQFAPRSMMGIRIHDSLVKGFNDHVSERAQIALDTANNRMFSDAVKNAATDEELAAVNLAASLRDDTGRWTPQGVEAIAAAKKMQNARIEAAKQGDGGKNYKVSYEEIGGRPSALIYVPGSRQAPKVVDLSILSPTDMVLFRDAVKRRGQAEIEMSDPIKSRNSAKYQETIDNADEEIRVLLRKAPATQQTSPAAAPATEVPSAAAPADDQKPFGEFKFRVVKP